MKKILITGGNGAIGSQLICSALEKNFEITNIDIATKSQLSMLKQQEIQFLNIDIRDKDAVERLFDKQKFDYVVHLAAFFANQNSIENPNVDLQTNIEGTLNILECLKYTENTKFIYISSSCVYDKDSQAKHENSPVGNFDTPYALSKYTGEKYVELYAKLYGIRYTIFRIFNSYGPYELPGKYRNLIPNFINLARQGKALTVFGEGLDRRDFTFNKDVCEGIIASTIFNESDGEVLNLGSGKSTSVIEVANIINNLYNNVGNIDYLPKRLWDNTSIRLANISKAQNMIRYNPTVELENGILLTSNWLTENFEI